MAPALANSRRTFLILLAVAILAVGVLPVSGAIRHPQHRLAVQQIQQLEAEWRAAQLGADVPAMDRLLSDDFLGITAAGTVVTKSQQLERMRTRQFAVKSLAVEDTKIKLVGAIAIVTSLAVLEGTSEGTAVSGSYRYTRVYQRVAGGMWKITSFEATRIPQPAGMAAVHGHQFAARNQ